jgi:hypothetical protein
MASPERDDPFFIGWADTPPADRRFFLCLGLGLMAGTAGLGAGLAALQRAPGGGAWDPDKVREWRGTVSAAPYAMLRSRDLGGDVPRTALLSCLGKCGVAAQTSALEGQPVMVTGSLIQRGQHAMLAVDEQGAFGCAATRALRPTPVWPFRPSRHLARSASAARSSIRSAGSAPCGGRTASCTRLALRCASAVAFRLHSSREAPQASPP